MNITSAATGIIAIIIGLGIGYMSHPATSANTHSMPDGTVMQDSADMESAMDAMTMGLSGKSGDAFDQEFLAEMIVHHQGAVDMAQAALQNAKHDEIKLLAQDIIAAQTKEIAQMKDWQASWYKQ